MPALPEALKATAEAAIFTARQCARRIQAGVDLVSDPAADRHAEALAAFRFANRAMLLQRQHTTIAALREAASETSYAQAKAEVEAEGKQVASWRPFQLAFMLLNLPALDRAWARGP